MRKPSGRSTEIAKATEVVPTEQQDQGRRAVKIPPDSKGIDNGSFLAPGVPRPK